MIAVLNQRLQKHIFKKALKVRKKYKKDIQLSEYYFGYGANLDTARFSKNNMCAQEIGSALLKNHELKFTLATEFLCKGYAGVHSKSGCDVPGVLVKIDKLSLSYLDKLEWCGFGAYERVLKEVEFNGEAFKAWVYIVKYPDFNRIPATLYLENMIKAAESKKFPKKYIEYLKNHESKDSFEIDHGFSLRTYKHSRKFVAQLKPVYEFHDKVRDKLCSLI